MVHKQMTCIFQSNSESLWKAEAGRSLRVRGQAGVQTEFQGRLQEQHREKPCLKKDTAGVPQYREGCITTCKVPIRVVLICISDYTFPGLMVMLTCSYTGLLETLHPSI